MKYPNKERSIGIFPESTLKVDPRLNFTRDSVAEYINKDGVLVIAPSGVPRIGKKGLIIDRSSTNRISYSNDFSNSFWTKARATVTALSEISPLGTPVYRVDNTAKDTAQTSGFGFVSAITAGGVYTFSLIIKPGTRKFVRISTSGTTFGDTAILFFNLETGEYRIDSSFEIVPNFEKIDNDWVRVSWTATAQTSENVSFLILLANTITNTPAIAVAGEHNFYIAGAQLESTPYPTSHISTNGSQVTRAGERFGIMNTGEINLSEGSGYIEVSTSSSNSWHDLVIGKPTSEISADRFTLTIDSDGTVQVAFPGDTSVQLQKIIGKERKRHRIAFSYKANSFINLSVNGISVGEVRNIALKPVSEITLCASMSNAPGSVATGTLHEFKYYRTALTVEELSLLTSE